MLMASVFTQNITEIVGIRGYGELRSNLNNHKENHNISDLVYCRNEWNAILFAVEHGYLPIIRFFIEYMKINALLSLCMP
jgi:hypothetical protein